MSQMLDGNYKAFPAGGAIGKFLLVKWGAGVLAVAGTTEEYVGVSMHDVFAIGETMLVRLRSGSGTCKMTAGEGIAQGAVVFGKASGLIGDSIVASEIRAGIALEAATNSGDIIEVLTGSP